MSRKFEMANATKSRPVDLIRALRDAGLTALIAFGLLLPLIGFQTTVNISNQLIVITRWPLLFAITAIVGLVYFIYSFGIEPRLKQRALRPVVAAPQPWRVLFGKWFVPFAIGFVIAYPAIVIA